MSFLDCIKRIPQLNKEIVANYPKQFECLSQCKGKIEKIVFVASGSSYNSASVAKYFIENQCELEVDVIYPNVFSQQKTHKMSDTILYVFISQTGATKQVYDDVMDLQESALAHNHYLPIVFLFLFYLYWNMLIPASQSQTAYPD